MGELAVQAGGGEALAEIADEPPGERARGAHRHLLPEERAHRELEGIPRTWDAEAGSRAHRGREERIERQVLRDRRRIGAQVEEALDARDGREEIARGGGMQRELERGAAARGANLEDGGGVADPDRARVAPRRGRLHAGDGARAEESNQARPVERRPVGQEEREGGAAPGAAGAPSKLARRGVERRPDGVVEAPNAREAGRVRDLGHRQRALLEELAGEVRASRLRDRLRRRADVRREEPAKVARADAEPLGERLEAEVVGVARLDEAERPRHGGGRARPGR